MKTNKFFQNSTKAMIAFMSATVMTLSFTACSQDNELLEPAANPQEAVTRGQNLRFVTYVERSWDGHKVVENVKYQDKYVELTGDKNSELTYMEAGKWYVVKGDCTRKTIYAPKTGTAHLIISDGAKLTARINIDEAQSLCIYGQEKNTGELIAKQYVHRGGTDDDGVARCCTYYPPHRQQGKHGPADHSRQQDYSQV